MSHDNAIRRLKDRYPADMVATWEIRGEDYNCDLGGSHYMPLLAVVEGRYDEVLEQAVRMGGFWQWGSGGEIKPIRVMRSVGELKALTNLADEESRLEKRLAEVREIRRRGVRGDQ